MRGWIDSEPIDATGTAPTRSVENDRIPRPCVEFESIEIPWICAGCINDHRTIGKFVLTDSSFAISKLEDVQRILDSGEFKETIDSNAIVITVKRGGQPVDDGQYFLLVDRAQGDRSEVMSAQDAIDGEKEGEVSVREECKG